MKRLITAAIALAVSVMFAAAQPAKERYEPGLGEFMTATHWDLAAYEIDEIKEGLEDARRLHPTLDGIPVAEMMKTVIDPRVAELEKAVSAKSNDRFTVAFDELTSGCNACHAAANKPFIRIQRPIEPPLTNQNFTPVK